MKREDAAFLLWVLYRTLCGGFMSMFVAGLIAGVFEIAGFDHPLIQYTNYLLLGGTGGMVLMGRGDERAKKLLKISGV